MASILPDPRSTRPPAFGERVVYSTWKGKPRVQKWPRKRGLPEDPYQQESISRFCFAQYIAKRCAPEQIAVAMEATKNTGLYPRDLLTRVMLGGLFEVALPDGRIVKRRPTMYELPTWIGFRVYRALPLNISASVTTPIPWTDVELNPWNLWAPGFSDYFEVPPGVSIMSFTAMARFQGSGTSFDVLTIGEVPLGRIFGEDASQANPENRWTFTTGPVPVTPGMRIGVMAYSNTANTLTGGVDRLTFSGTVLG